MCVTSPHGIIWWMRNKRGQFVKGHNSSPNTEFKKGQHWRKPKPHWNRDWLYRESITNKRPAPDIAKEVGCISANIIYWLKKHNIPRRSTAETRAIKHWGQSGKNNPMFGIKGEKHPRWIGGVTPERQAFYNSTEWKDARHIVWKRDKGTCQECRIKGDTKQRSRGEFHLHHIVAFADSVELRADPNNLIVLCAGCHHWAHSLKNKENKWRGGRDDFATS